MFAQRALVLASLAGSRLLDGITLARVQEDVTANASPDASDEGMNVAEEPAKLIDPWVPLFGSIA